MTNDLKEIVTERLECLEEHLAALEHERWARWQSYMHSMCEPQKDGSLLIPSELVRRWKNQIAVPYESLSDEEKESDREQVRRYMPVIVRALTR